MTWTDVPSAATPTSETAIGSGRPVVQCGPLAAGLGDAAGGEGVEGAEVIRAVGVELAWEDAQAATSSSAAAALLTGGCRCVPGRTSRAAARRRGRAARRRP